MSTDFVAWATGFSANVKDLSAYQADPATQQGVSSGLANSQQFNRIARQATFIAAGVANFVANELNINVLDDGNLPNFINNLTNALISIITGTQGHFYTGAGNPNGQQQGLAGGSANPPDLYEDTNSGDIWVCTTSGTAATAQWRLVSTPTTGAVSQTGGVTTNHLASWAGNAVVQDSGIAAANVMARGGAIANGDFPLQSGSGFIDSNAGLDNLVIWGGTSTGSANAQVMAATSPSFTTLTQPTLLLHKAGFTNTGALTLNVNSIGAQQTRKPGASGPVVLNGGEVVAGNLVGWCWDGSFWQLLFSFSVGFTQPPPWGRSLITCTNAPAAPNTSVTITAFNLPVSSFNSAATVLAGPGQISPFTGTCDLTINGVNGLDTGTRAGSTGYYIWLISNGQGTFATLASLSNTQPTMPSGFTFQCPIAWFPTDSSGNLYRLFKHQHQSQFMPTAGTNTASYPILIRGPQTNHAVATSNFAGALVPSDTINLRLCLQSDVTNLGNNVIVSSNGDELANAITPSGGSAQVVTFDTANQAMGNQVIVFLTSANALVSIVGFEVHF